MPPKIVQPLDDVDRRLVRALQEDGRRTNHELARLAGIAPSTCVTRLRSLQQRGVVRGIHADVDPEWLGLNIQAMIAVRLRAESRGVLTKFADLLAERPYVVNVFFVSGSYDYLVHVGAGTTDDLRDIVTDLSGAVEVAGTETHVIFEHLTGRPAV